MRQPRIGREAPRLVFIDGEPWCAMGSSTNGERNHDKDDQACAAVTRKASAGSPRRPSATGWRLGAPRVRAPSRRQTFIAALRYTGLTAPVVVEAPMNRSIFDAYVETELAPTLNKGEAVKRWMRLESLRDSCQVSILPRGS